MKSLNGIQAVVTGGASGVGRATVVILSSGAALGGSPLTGGYGGAKWTQKLLALYFQGPAIAITGNSGLEAMEAILR